MAKVKVDLTKYSEEQKQEIYDLYKRGNSKTKVSQILGLSREICRLIINEKLEIELQTLDIRDLIKDYDYLVTYEQMKKVKVDYWKNPIKRGEKPLKDDLYYLFIELNLPLEFLEVYFRTTSTTIKTWCRSFGIEKPKQQAAQVAKIMNLHRYGQETTTSLPWVQEKTKRTCLERYGVDNAMKSLVIQQRYVDTCMDRYGVTNTAKLSETQVKMKATSMERYGKPNISMTEQNKQHLREIFPQTLEKMKATSLEKYGYEYTLQVPEIREAGEQTCLEKYGVRFASQSDVIREKVDNTFKLNGSYHKSQPEEDIYVLLVEKFGKDDIDRQHKTEEYPFKCDFYIYSLNLYIEYQEYWKHGGEPFNTTNLKHQEIISFWQHKSEELSWNKKLKGSYLDAINVWTKKDPLKRETARKNNLNWIEFFNMKEFMDWYNSL